MSAFSNAAPTNYALVPGAGDFHHPDFFDAGTGDEDNTYCMCATTPTSDEAETGWCECCGRPFE